MWYHVSRCFLGNEQFLYPRVPNMDTFCRCEEGNIPRICVSNSILNCIRAITGNKIIYSINIKRNFLENPCVYATEEVPLLPPNCLDFRQNEERWFLKKTKFVYLGRVDMNQLLIKKIIVPTHEKELVLPDKNIVVKTAKEYFILNILNEFIRGSMSIGELAQW